MTPEERADSIVYLRQRIAVVAQQQPRSMAGRVARDAAIAELRRDLEKVSNNEFLRVIHMASLEERIGR